MVKLEVGAVHPALGVEVAGLHLDGTLDAKSVNAVRELFDEYGLLLFRGLDVSPEDQAYLVGCLIGESGPTGRDAAVANTHTYANYVTNRDADGYAPFGELLFHCDMMWAESPMEAISLYGVRVDPPSVPTRFASMARAWDTLPGDLRTRVDGLSAVHVTGQQRRGDHKGELVEVKHENTRSTVKPLVWRHPRTGRPLLYACQQMTARIEGLPDEESESLLEELFAHMYRSDSVFEHDWRQGDLVIWDNLSTQHARGNVEIQGPERTLRKVIGPTQPDMGIRRPKMVPTLAN